MLLWPSTFIPAGLERNKVICMSFSFFFFNTPRKFLSVLWCAASSWVYFLGPLHAVPVVRRLHSLWNLLKCQPDNNCIIILRAGWRKVAGGGYKKPGLCLPVWYDIYSLAIDAQDPSLRVKHGIISVFVVTVLEEWAASLQQAIDDQSLCGRTQRKQVLCEVSAQPRIPS